ncbi:outer inflammatory protein OipA [Helicobacter pylori]
MINYLIIISNLKLKENHEKSSLTLSLSFWLHAERNGFYLGSDILGGSYVQATVNTNEFNPNNLLNNPYPQNYPSSPSPSNSNNPYAKYYPPTSSFPSNPNNSNTVSSPGGSGDLFNELSFGYKYFLGKKRIIGFRHSLFFGYQVGYLGGLIAFLPYGFDTDLLINLWKNDDLDKRHSSADYIIKHSSGFVIGVNIGASTWFSPATTTIFQFQGKFGVRWNHDKYNARRYLGGSSVELGVKVPAFGVYDNTFRRVVSVYLNYTYNFKN